ncbi:MAG: hypothetical protein KF708_11325 [Pirellulales bacterium]|nr:hypothetical protein [Pirellulales bacterium]
MLLLALAVRLGLVLALRTEHQRPLAYEHGAIAENLLAGRGFSITYLGQTGPTSQQAPLYPLLVTAAYACFGAGSQAAILAIQLLQCAAGTWLVYLVMLLAWRLVPAPRAVGWCAGWSAALYPPHVYMVTHVQVALWGALLLTGLLLMTLQRPAAEAWRVPLTAGVLAGLMLLVEPILVLAIPVAMVAYYLQQPTSDRPRDARRRRFCQALAIPAIAGIVIAPWIVRNYLVHGEPVFVKSTFGYAFWQGNNAQSWGTDKIPKPSAAAISQEHDGTLAGADRALWEARHETLYIDDVLLKPRGYAEFAGLSEPERSRVLQARAMEFIAREPARYLALCVNRLRYMLLFDETNPKASHVVYRVSSIVWLVLAFVGLLSSRAQWRTLWPTVAIFGLVMGFHTLTIASARFRIPLEPMTLVWTSLAVAPALARLFRRRAEAPTTILPMVVPGRDEAHPLRGPHQPARHGTAPHETARRRSA